MKNFFLFAFLFFSIQSFSQNISGIYSGTLVNDSAKGTQQYELALSEYREKITGYAYATFIVNDTFYYSVRRVKATREGDQLVVEDEEMLANNFPVRPDKGVRRISYIPLQNLKEGDTLTTFAGSWKTNRVKNKFHSVPGTMDMKRDNDSAHSALVAHLRELNIIAPENKMAVNDLVPAENPAFATHTQPKKKTVAATKTTPAQSKHEDLKKLEPAAAKPAANTTATPAAIPYNERKTPPAQSFDVGSDSLVLSFYDNGVVDGDVISVYVNGETIIANAKLLESATKKTIHLAANTDSVELLLVAETLGNIPPNTGLLVVQDGSARYEVHFSADLQTNASIVFRKRK